MVRQELSREWKAALFAGCAKWFARIVPFASKKNHYKENNNLCYGKLYDSRSRDYLCYKLVTTLLLKCIIL